MKFVILAVLTLAITLSHADNDEYAKFGGLVQLSGKGFVAAIDCRSNGDAADYAEGKKAVADTFLIEIRNVNGTQFKLETAVDQLRASGGNCAVFIVDDPTLPMSLSAHEEKWGLLNVAKIVGDIPQKQFKRRTSLLFARQALRVLGADEAKSENTCLHSVFSASDLDKITSYDLPMGAEMAIPETMTMRGIEKIEFGTYEEACEIGVAAHPTNDVQKAIWEKIQNKKADKADPTNRWKRDFPDKEKPKSK